MKISHTKYLVLLLSIFALFELVGVQVAYSYSAKNHTFGFGSRAASMGGAFTAMSNDASSIFYNPGALGTLEHATFEIGHFWTFPDLQFNGEDHEIEEARGFDFMLAIPLKVMGRTATIGLGTIVHDQYLQRLTLLAQSTPRFLIYENLISGTDLIYVSSGFEVTKHLSLGAGAQIADSGDKLNIALDVNAAGEGLSGDSLVDLNLGSPDPFLTAGALVDFGFISEALNPLEMGISYRHKTFLKLASPFTINVNLGEADGVITVDTVISAYMGWYPTEYALGFHYNFQDYFKFPLRLLTDFTLRRWSEFDNFASTNGITINITGSEASVATAEDIEANFKDVVAVRAGLEYSLHPSPKAQIDLRLGYYFQPSPVPEQTGELNFIDHDTHTFSAGLGITGINFTEILPAPVSLDVHGTYTLFPREEAKKSAATDPVGSWEAEGDIIGVGTTLTLRF
ncbi:MAG: outer membrane protein transport protein [Deltaproteobacteria bacterium]|nr:outer membrane protein transport protein [Deltaproteobacteria bacterium]